MDATSIRLDASLPAAAPLIDCWSDARHQTRLQSRLMVTDWAVKLGQQRSAQEQATREASRAARLAAADDASTALIRWSHIVEAMTELVAAYNQGAGREAINIAEDRSASRGPTVILRAGGDDAPRLSVTLEGSAIYARRLGVGNAAGETEYRLGPDRSDDETAAYVLQHWMAQL
jgi:hypothetical protein